MEIKNFPRKPDAEFAINNNFASGEEQVSSDTVQIGTFSKYQPQRRTRSSHRKGGASLLTIQGLVDEQIMSVLIDSGLPARIDNEHPFCRAPWPCAQSRALKRPRAGMEA
jgi:hypothetical protein